MKESHSVVPSKRLLPWALLLTFFVLPWLKWNDTPILLIDLQNRQLYLLAHVFDSGKWISLLCMAIASTAALYLLTHIAGRLWCGYLCPQTVLGTLHAYCTQRCGSRATRCICAVSALMTGITFIGYFLPIRSLFLSPFDGWGGWSLFWAGFYAIATWANIHYLKSRVCTEFCPFARLQPWISDKHTLHVFYHSRRGEPRGPRQSDLADIATRGRRLLDPVTANDYVMRSANPWLSGPLPRFPATRLGDCTDCGHCQTACPIGIDIRNGYDARCLDCGHCISACDDEMRKRNYPTGLIVRCAQSPHKGWLPRPITYRTVIATVILCASILAAIALA